MFYRAKLSFFMGVLIKQGTKETKSLLSELGFSVFNLDQTGLERSKITSWTINGHKTYVY